jgi:excisionase family DNA binding protein
LQAAPFPTIITVSGDDAGVSGCEMKKRKIDALTKRKALLVGEFAAQSGLSTATVRRGCHTGEITATRIGKLWLIPVSELDRRFAAAAKA